MRMVDNNELNCGKKISPAQTDVESDAFNARTDKSLHTSSNVQKIRSIQTSVNSCWCRNRFVYLFSIVDQQPLSGRVRGHAHERNCPKKVRNWSCQFNALCEHPNEFWTCWILCVRESIARARCHRNERQKVRKIVSFWLELMSTELRFFSSLFILSSFGV